MSASLVDIFQQRIFVDEAAEMVEAAKQLGLLDGANTAIFHHLGIMRARFAELSRSFPPNALHAVAIKANPVLEVLRELSSSGAGLEAASLEEVHLALAAGCPAERVVFDSPAKTIAEIRESLHLGIYLNVDNFDELNRVAAEQQLRPSRSVVGLRVNPNVGGGSIAQTSVADTGSKFAILMDANREQIINAFRQHSWLGGLHVHVGSQGCHVAQLVEAVARLAELRRQIARECDRTVAHVDIGGGLPTIYHGGQTAPTPCEYVQQLKERAADLFSPDVRLITEFGRAIHANCGIAVSRVEYVKRSQQLAVIHLGADLFLRPVYRSSDWSHEFFVLDTDGFPKSTGEAPVTIAGPLCFAGDILARDVMLPEIEPENWIVIRDVGAYTLSMWSRHCNRGIPAILGYDPQSAESLRILRPAESPADVVQFWSSTAYADQRPDIPVARI